MTIKEFSDICGCNPQTIRYYDRINLLKPVKVDPVTGYRFYSEEQTLLYIKIKNLQEAMFSIEEIKELLGKSDDEIFDAFSRKISEQEQKLETMKKIQRSYQNEMMAMKEKIEEIRERIQTSAQQYNPEEEFGIDNNYYRELISKVSDYMSQALTIMGDVDFTEVTEEEEMEEEPQYSNPKENPKYHLVWEKHNWERAKEFLHDIPQLSDGKEYLFQVEVNGKKEQNLAFPNVVLGVALDKNQGKKLSLACNVTHSEDGENHFLLFENFTDF